jgi:hypothetical protein
VESGDQQTPVGGQAARRAHVTPQRLFDVAFFVPNDSSLVSLPTSPLAAVADACITSGVGDGGVASSHEASSHDYAWQFELLNQWVKLEAQYVGCTTGSGGGTLVSTACQVCQPASRGCLACMCLVARICLGAPACFPPMNLSRLNGRRTPLSPPFLSLFLSLFLSCSPLSRHCALPFKELHLVCHRAKQVWYELCRLVRVW